MVLLQHGETELTVPFDLLHHFSSAFGSGYHLVNKTFYGTCVPVPEHIPIQSLRAFLLLCDLAFVDYHSSVGGKPSLRGRGEDFWRPIALCDITHEKKSQLLRLAEPAIDAFEADALRHWLKRNAAPEDPVNPLSCFVVYDDAPDDHGCYSEADVSFLNGIQRSEEGPSGRVYLHVYVDSYSQLIVDTVVVVVYSSFLYMFMVWVSPPESHGLY